MGFLTRRATLLSVFVPVAVALAGCNQPASTPAPAATAAPAISPVEKGRLLVAGGGCHDCHTPKKIGPNGPEADLDRSLAGHPESVGVLPHFEDAKGSKYSTHTSDDLTLRGWYVPSRNGAAVIAFPGRKSRDLRFDGG